MKHIFIISTKSNNTDFTKKLCESIENTCKNENVECDIMLTKKPHDAENFARSIAESGEHCRVYACGGDGTVCEVANGIYGHDNVEFAVYPIGTGNDFVKSFGGKTVFSNLKDIILSKAFFIDCLKLNERICMNIANIGFDSAVVKNVEKIRKKRLIPKSLAYPLSVAYTLIKFPKESLTIEFDNGEKVNGGFLLSLFANAQYYGGGYKSASEAKVDDGLIDAVVVKPVGRLTFLKRVSSFQKGTLLGTPEADELLSFRRCKSLTMKKETEFDLCYDGEFMTAKEVRIECIPKAINIALPEKVFALSGINCFENILSGSPKNKVTV